MLAYIRDLIWSALKYVASWLLDLLVWVFEWVYGLVSECLQWLYDLCGEMLIAALNAVAEVMPDGLVDVVLETYEWLEYIDGWVPVKYGIGLLLAYFSIMVILTVIRWVFRLIPGLGG